MLHLRARDKELAQYRFQFHSIGTYGLSYLLQNFGTIDWVIVNLKVIVVKNISTMYFYLSCLSLILDMMVRISTVYRFTMFMYSNLQFLAKKSRSRETWGQWFDSWKVFSCSIFRDITFLTSFRFLQYHGSRFYATYHSSSSRQITLSTSYRRNNKVWIEQKSYRGFRMINCSKLIFRLTINTI
jgi:hypothetical protein